VQMTAKEGDTAMQADQLCSPQARILQRVMNRAGAPQ
jgi:hypothetical protein